MAGWVLAGCAAGWWAVLQPCQQEEVLLMSTMSISLCAGPLLRSPFVAEARLLFGKTWNRKKTSLMSLCQK